MEYLSAYYNGSTSILGNGSSFASNGGKSTKYTTAYTKSREYSGYKIGDATHETFKWNKDDGFFIWNDLPFFYRGGYRTYTSSAGIFCFDTNDGHSLGDNSFRMCLAVK